MNRNILELNSRSSAFDFHTENISSSYASGMKVLVAIVLVGGALGLWQLGPLR